MDGTFYNGHHEKVEAMAKWPDSPFASLTVVPVDGSTNELCFTSEQVASGAKRGKGRRSAAYICGTHILTADEAISLVEAVEEKKETAAREKEQRKVVRLARKEQNAEEERIRKAKALERERQRAEKKVKSAAEKVVKEAEKVTRQNAKAERDAADLKDKLAEQAMKKRKRDETALMANKKRKANPKVWLRCSCGPGRLLEDSAAEWTSGQGTVSCATCDTIWAHVACVESGWNCTLCSI